jgi:hypothetical protein
MTFRALTDTGTVRGIQPSGFRRGGKRERCDGANFTI